MSQENNAAPESSGENQKNANKLSLFTLIGLVVANMIGAGVFTTSGFSLADLGSPHLVLLAWLAGGFIAVSGAISYGFLSKYITDSGGEYLFISRFIHPFAGFIAGWVSLLAGFTGAIAFAALTFEIYFKPIIPFQFPKGFLAVSLVVIAALIHGIKLNFGVKIQNFAVVLKFVLILLFVAIAGFSTKSFFLANETKPIEFSFLSFANSLVWISLSYSGYNAAIYVSGETAHQNKTVQRSMLIGTLIVTFIYLLLNSVFMYLAPNSLTVGKEDVAAIAAASIGGESLALLIRLIIIISLLTSVFAMIMAGPRVYAKMAEDKVFPEIFRFQGEVPTFAIILQAVLAIILISFSTVKDLLSYLGFTLSLCACLTVFCIFLVDKSKFDNKKDRIITYLSPTFFIITTLILSFLVLWRNPLELMGTFLTIVSGAVFYFLFRKTVP